MSRARASESLGQSATGLDFTQTHSHRRRNLWEVRPVALADGQQTSVFILLGIRMLGRVGGHTFQGDQPPGARSIPSTFRERRRPPRASRTVRRALSLPPVHRERVFDDARLARRGRRRRVADRCRGLARRHDPHPRLNGQQSRPTSMDPVKGWPARAMPRCCMYLKDAGSTSPIVSAISVARPAAGRRARAAIELFFRRCE